MLRVSPPPNIAKYLFSANNNLLVPLPVAHDEADNFGVEMEGNCLYYRLV